MVAVKGPTVWGIRGRAAGVLLLMLVAGCAATSSGSPPPPAPAARTESATTPTPAPSGGVAPSAAPAVPERVTLAMSSRSLSFLPQFLARSLGYYASEGLDVETLIMRSDLQIAGLLSGELDYSAVGGEPLALALTEGAPLRSILIAFDNPHFTLVGQKGMDRAQLRGARIGVSRLGSVSHATGRALVSHLGLDPESQVQFFGTGETSTSFAALEARAIDAAILSPPFSSELVSQGYAALARNSELAEKSPFTGLAASSDHLRAQPDQAVRLVRAVRRSLAVIAQDRPRVLDHLTREWEIAPEAAEALYLELVGPLRVDGRMSPAELQQYLDRLLADGIVKRPVTASELADFSYLDRAGS